MREASAQDALQLLSGRRSLLLAVSGGPDLVALMLLCAQWRERDAHEIAVATVDHGLRRESRGEAEQVGRWAQALGFAHHLLTWEGDKPASRIQERARAARYGLLSQCAAQIGASAIVTAHHADDQAETILFRLTRGSGVTGLAGMAPFSACGDFALLRPLLNIGKTALVEICEQAGHAYFSDPSNHDVSYARTRLRELLPSLAAQGLDRAALLRLGERAGRADAALDHHAREASARACVSRESDGPIFDSAALRELPRETLQRLLGAEMIRLAPGATLRLDRLESAAQRLSEALATGSNLRITLANILIEARPGAVALSPAPPRRGARPGTDSDS